ncbi:MAG: acyl-CoA thioesterase [Firmicutes bacterium HGW-Firmicutes-1]|jgi:acyl-CoA hydrolase|nr:MAG: acyl-CoA thioesterase [Firmicutes bacterium HGW-Firmicutes-1]
MDKKTTKESEVRMTELVLPNDTNLIGNLLGGRLMYWVDIVGALAASRHCRNVVATVQVDSIDFKNPIKRGDMVELFAKLTWVGRTSMEVKVTVYSENLFTGEKILTNEAYLVFVSLDRHRNPVRVPGLLLETEDEMVEWEKAIARKAYRMKNK